MPPKASSSEFTIINGQKYDKELLAIAKKSAKDGTIELDEAKKLWASALDGKKVTITERKTLQYIVAKHKVADDARTFLLGKLGFEEINGVRYDKDLMVLARQSMKDGAIEIGEAKKLWKSAMDGKKVTELEAKTLRYIMSENNCAADAKVYLADKMGIEEIKGQWYEKDLLAIAKECMKDGSIELAEAKQLWKAAMDGKKVTQIEAKTLRYIVTQNKVSADAKEYMKARLKEAIEAQAKEDAEFEAEPWMLNLDEGEILEGAGIQEEEDLRPVTRAASPLDPLAKLAIGLNGMKRDREYALAIVKSYGLALAYVPEELKNDRELVLEAVRKNGLALKYAAQILKNDKGIVVTAVNNHPAAINFAGKEIIAERRTMIEVVQNQGSALCRVAEPLKADYELVMEAVKSDGLALKHAAEDLKIDREVVMEAVKSKGYALQFAADELKADRQLVMAAVKSNGSALEFAADELKADRNFALAAVQCKAYALLYVAEELKSDREIVREACRLDPFVQEYAAKELRHIVLDLPKAKRTWCIHTKQYI